jgi:hypothetical protein
MGMLHEQWEIMAGKNHEQWGYRYNGNTMV